jgi:hypothetical protein
MLRPRPASLPLLVALWAATLLPSQPVEGQGFTTADERLWLQALGQYAPGEHWQVNNDMQYRHGIRANWDTNWEQWLLRPSVTWLPADWGALTLGYTYLHTAPDDGLTSVPRVEEHNIWQQWVLSQQGGAQIQVSHRFRIEQRFQRHWHATPDGGRIETRPVRVRPRYRLTLSRPMVPAWGLSAFVFSEIFVNATPRNSGRPVFNQAWARGGLSWQPRASAHTVSLAYQLQVSQSGRRIPANHILFVGYNLLLKASPAESR